MSRFYGNSISYGNRNRKINSPVCRIVQVLRELHLLRKQESRDQLTSLSDCPGSTGIPSLTETGIERSAHQSVGLSRFYGNSISYGNRNREISSPVCRIVQVLRELHLLRKQESRDQLTSLSDCPGSTGTPSLTETGIGRLTHQSVGLSRFYGNSISYGNRNREINSPVCRIVQVLREFHLLRKQESRDQLTSLSDCPGSTGTPSLTETGIERSAHQSVGLSRFYGNSISYGNRNREINSPVCRIVQVLRELHLLRKQESRDQLTSLSDCPGSTGTPSLTETGIERSAHQSVGLSRFYGNSISYGNRNREISSPVCRIVQVLRELQLLVLRKQESRDQLTSLSDCPGSTGRSLTETGIERSVTCLSDCPGSTGTPSLTETGIERSAHQSVGLSRFYGNSISYGNRNRKINSPVCRIVQVLRELHLLRKQESRDQLTSLSDCPGSTGTPSLTETGIERSTHQSVGLSRFYGNSISYGNRNREISSPRVCRIPGSTGTPSLTETGIERSAHQSVGLSRFYGNSIS